MKVPGWGKAVGIIMIILGSLGIFYQAYKIMAPKIFEMQQQMMSNMSNAFEMNEEMDNNSVRMNPEAFLNTFQETFRISDVAKNWLPTFGIIGLLLCIYYIIGGVLLLKPKALNYKIALSALVSMIALNIISYIVVFSEGNSLMLIGLMIYSFVGVAFDVALLIICLTSNKSSYGIGEAPIKEAEIIDSDDVF